MLKKQNIFLLKKILEIEIWMLICNEIKNYKI